MTTARWTPAHEAALQRAKAREADTFEVEIVDAPAPRLSPGTRARAEVLRREEQRKWRERDARARERKRSRDVERSEGR